MRIVVEPVKVIVKGGQGEEAVTKEKEARTVKYGKEDLLLVFIVALILAGLGLGKLTFEQALGYIGVSTSGGVWGLLSGNASEK
jgi:hypothetical protein